MSQLDLLVTGGAVITMDAANRVIDDGAVGIAGDRIVAVGPSADLRSRYPNPAKTLDAHRHAVLPGLIDTFWRIAKRSSWSSLTGAR